MKEIVKGQNLIFENQIRTNRENCKSRATDWEGCAFSRGSRDSFSAIGPSWVFKM